MFVKLRRSGYGRDGQQVASGLFLIMMQRDRYRDASGNYLPASEWRLLEAEGHGIRCVVRFTSLRQLGHFMMGSARIHGHTLTLSGSYGSDGLPCTVPDAIWEKGVPLPDELYRQWNAGGGWNGAGNEAAAIQEWALANLAALRGNK